MGTTKCPKCRWVPSNSIRHWYFYKSSLNAYSNIIKQNNEQCNPLTGIVSEGVKPCPRGNMPTRAVRHCPRDKNSYVAGNHVQMSTRTELLRIMASVKSLWCFLILTAVESWENICSSRTRRPWVRSGEYAQQQFSPSRLSRLRKMVNLPPENPPVAHKELPAPGEAVGWLCPGFCSKHFNAGEHNVL